MVQRYFNHHNDFMNYKVWKGVNFISSSILIQRLTGPGVGLGPEHVASVLQSSTHSSRHSDQYSQVSPEYSGHDTSPTYLNPAELSFPISLPTYAIFMVILFHDI